MSLARPATTISGLTCILSEESRERKVFVQNLTRIDESRTLTIRPYTISDEIPAYPGLEITGILLNQQFELSAYTPDTQDELPYHLVGVQSGIELRITPEVAGALYTREVEVEEDGSERVLFTKIADLRDCQEASAVVVQNVE